MWIHCVFILFDRSLCRGAQNCECNTLLNVPYSRDAHSGLESKIALHRYVTHKQSNTGPLYVLHVHTVTAVIILATL